MLTNDGNTEGLFHAAFMHSGSPIPVGDITHGQVYYDFLVEQTGCAGASDTLACLRTVSSNDLQAAIDQTPFALSYQVRGVLPTPREQSFDAVSAVFELSMDASSGR